MVNDQFAEKYADRLTSMIKTEENLWDKSHFFYGDEEMEQASWKHITTKLNIIYKTNEITVESVKATWENIKVAFEESKQFETATIFALISLPGYLDVTEDRSSVYDGLFSRQKGKYLVLLQIIVNILFIVIGCYVSVVTNPTKEEQVCAGEINAYAILFFAMFSLLDDRIDPCTMQYGKQSFYQVLVFSIFVAFSTSYSLFLHINGEDCYKMALEGKYIILGYLLVFTMATQYIVTLQHQLKLDRPPTMNEMSTVLIVELILASAFFILRSTSQWGNFFLAMTVCICANYLILLCYYYICWKHAKILYKFQKRSRLAAVSCATDPFVVKFEREE